MSDLASERDFYNKKLASIDALLSVRTRVDSEG
mgnify:FL=1|jgi:hypothetical protein